MLQPGAEKSSAGEWLSHKDLAPQRPDRNVARRGLEPAVTACSPQGAFLPRRRAKFRAPRVP